MHGDVNCNGSIEIADVTDLIDYILNGNDAINLANADCDQNGQVNISDVTALSDYILNGQW